MSSKLGVGIVGVGGSPSGWARTGHVPAIAAVEGLQLTAVSAQSQDSAEAGATAAADLGPHPRAYGDVSGLIADPRVDIVSIVSPVPTHEEIIRAAIDAGKPVFTEWPVTPGAAATGALARDAQSAGVHVAVGLQARTGPAARELRRLLDAGAIGRVLSVNVLSTTAGFGPHIEPAMLSLEDPATGMNLLTIQAAHTLDLAAVLGGGLQSLEAQTTIQFPQLSVGDDGQSCERVLPDHVAIHGRLRGGGALVLEVAGGRPADATPFRFEIVGEDGRLTLAGGGARGFQAGRQTLLRDGAPVELDGGLPGDVPDVAVNLASAYAAMRADLEDGGSRGPSLVDAVALAALLDQVRAAAARPQVNASQPSAHA